MPVPARITDFSATAASNSPAGTDTVGPNLDDYLRAIQAVIRGDLATKGADIASATTTDLGAVQGSAHDITGTTTITGFGTVAAGIAKLVKFEGALTLTHNATSLILPGRENITTADGDTALMVSEGSGNWRCYQYVPEAINPAKTVSTDESQTLINKTLTSPTIQGTVGAGTGLTLPALVLSGNVTSSGNPSLNIGSGALTAGATSVTTLGATGDISATGKLFGSFLQLAAGSQTTYFSADATGPYIEVASGKTMRILQGDGLAVTGALSATTTIKTGGYTVGTLPAGTVGMRAYVTDATVPLYNAALTGGGAVTVPVFYNGAAWVSA